MRAAMRTGEENGNDRRAGTGRPREAPAGGRGAAERLGIDRSLLELLVCPLGGAGLVPDAENGVLVSRHARLAYPVRDGVPILIPAEACVLDEHDPRLYGGPTASRRRG